MFAVSRSGFSPQHIRCFQRPLDIHMRIEIFGLLRSIARFPFVHEWRSVEVSDPR
jgi:hypothetical protein